MDTLRSCLRASSSDPAIIVADKPPKYISHIFLASNVEKLQRTLASRAIGRGVRVSVVLPNPYDFTVVFLALALQSSIVAPLNHGLKAPELLHYFRDFNTEVVVMSAEEVERQGPAYAAAKENGLRITTCSVINNEVAIQLPDSSELNTKGDTSVEEHFETGKPKPEDPALVLYTSGTTGRPKAVPLTHSNLACSISNIVGHYSLTASDRALLIMPLFHIHGLVAGLLAPLASGGAVILTTRGGLAPSFFRDARTHGATWYTGTPTLHKLACQIPMIEDPNFRFVRSCSSRLEGPLLRELEKRYGCPVVEAYAMTEAAHQVCSNPVESTGTREGSVGKPTGVELKIMDGDGGELRTGEVGEVCIKGKNVMEGYWYNLEANAKSFTASGFFRTGDQGKISADGYVVLTGRIKELINKGGEKISPVEIDSVINQHPDVAEAVTFTIPDEMYGEEIGVAVIVKDGASMNEFDLKAWVGERLLLTKIPKKVFLVDTIPKTPVGKMQRSLVASTILGADS